MFTGLLAQDTPGEVKRSVCAQGALNFGEWLTGFSVFSTVRRLSAVPCSHEPGTDCGPYVKNINCSVTVTATSLQCFIGEDGTLGQLLLGTLQVSASLNTSPETIDEHPPEARRPATTARTRSRSPLEPSTPARRSPRSENSQLRRRTVPDLTAP